MDWCSLWYFLECIFLVCFVSVFGVFFVCFSVRFLRFLLNIPLKVQHKAVSLDRKQDLLASTSR